MRAKKQSWVTIEEASLYFNRREGASLRWDKLTKNEQQQLLNKSIKLILDSGLYTFPDSPEHKMKEAQYEQALWFLTRPDLEKEIFEHALHPEAKKRLEKYKNPALEKKNIKETNWDNDRDRNQLLEGKFDFGGYELRLSLVYINQIQHIQNNFYDAEIAKKVKGHLKEAQKIWKNRGEKYPLMKALIEFWPHELKIIPSETDKLIQKNIDQIIEKLSSYEYLIPKRYNLEDILKIDTESFYIKPQNLIVLTWAKAFQVNKMIYWKIIANTLNSIYCKIKRTNLGEIFDDVSKEEAFENRETIRQIYYKYIDHPAKMDLVNSIYKKSFKEKISPFYKVKYSLKH